MRILGIDPGVTNSGFAFFVDNKLEYWEHYKTAAKVLTRGEQVELIGLRVATLINEYEVEYIACEAFLHQAWKGAVTAVAAMGMLICEITWQAGVNRVPCILQDSKIKAAYSDNDLKIILGEHITPEHCRDAARHALVLEAKLRHGGGKSGGGAVDNFRSRFATVSGKRSRRTG